MTAKREDTEDYYSILNCCKQSTYEELKQSYQQLIRQYHPDKYNGSQEEFVKIDRAWKILRDDYLRKEYNCSQTQTEFEDNNLVHMEINKADVNFKDEDKIRYPCRCGSEFEILKEYLVEEECVIECNQCTNCILIK